MKRGKMKIGLVDVDGHNFPNLCLMKLSAWHKANGDEVEFAIPFCPRFHAIRTLQCIPNRTITKCKHSMWNAYHCRHLFHFPTIATLTFNLHANSSPRLNLSPLRPVRFYQLRPLSFVFHNQHTAAPFRSPVPYIGSHH